MGYVSIIEINHDEADKIHQDPAFFGEAVYRSVAAGDALTEVVRIPGGRIIQTFSVSGADPITPRIFDLWTNFKRELGEIVGRKIF